MIDDEKSAYLASYDAWKAPPPEGWQSMADLPLWKYEAQFLFADDSTDWWPISNMWFACDPRQPIAYRCAISREELQRKNSAGKLPVRKSVA